MDLDKAEDNLYLPQCVLAALLKEEAYINYPNRFQISSRANTMRKEIDNIYKNI